MGGENPEPQDDGALLSEALKRVRRHRGLTKVEVARGMNMPIRTYNRFEAGETRLNLDYIHRFAQVTRSDPQGLLMSIAIGSPEHAVRVANNQLATVLTVGLKDFDTVVGDDIGNLDSRTIVAAVIRMFEELADAARGPDPAKIWLERGVDGLRARRPKPGR